MLGKIDPFALNFRINGIYRLKDCICKYNAIFNWIILDSVNQFRYGHKIRSPDFFDIIPHTPTQQQGPRCSHRFSSQRKTH